MYPEATKSKSKDPLNFTHLANSDILAGRGQKGPVTPISGRNTHCEAY